MSGVVALWYLLKTDAAVIAVVPAKRIMSGVLPVGTTLPAIGITSISGVPMNTVAMNESHGLITERVQVTWQSISYSQQRQLLSLVLQACPNQAGTINSVSVLSIMPDTIGPDFEDIDPKIYTQSRDFIVRWRETR